MASSSDSEWAGRQSSVLESNWFMFESRQHTEVVFSLRERPGDSDSAAVEVPAHKYVLVSRSPVFEAMFCGALAETGQQINIDDIPADSFTELLRYLYCDESYLTGENVMSVLYAAKKYMVSPLIANCREFIKATITVEEVFVIRQHCIALGDEILQEKCLDFIRENTEIVLKSATLKDISREVMELLVTQESLNIAECRLFEICVSWAKAHIDSDDPSPAQIREQCNSLLANIRFPTMRVKEFSECVIPCELLTAEEENEIFRYLASKGQRGTRFNAAPRGRVPLTLKVFDELSLCTYQLDSENDYHYNINGCADQAVQITAMNFVTRQQNNRTTWIDVSQVHIFNTTGYNFVAGKEIITVGSRTHLSSALQTLTDVGFVEHDETHVLSKLEFREAARPLIGPGTFTVRIAVTCINQPTVLSTIGLQRREHINFLSMNNSASRTANKNGVKITLKPGDCGPLYSMEFNYF